MRTGIYTWYQRKTTSLGAVVLDPPFQLFVVSSLAVIYMLLRHMVVLACLIRARPIYCVGGRRIGSSSGPSLEGGAEQNFGFPFIQASSGISPYTSIV